MNKNEWVDKASDYLVSKQLTREEEGQAPHLMSKVEAKEFADDLYDSMTAEEIMKDMREFIDDEVSYWND